MSMYRKSSRLCPSDSELKMLQDKALLLMLEADIAQELYQDAAINHFHNAFEEVHRCSINGCKGRLEFSDETCDVLLVEVFWRWDIMCVRYRTKTNKGFSKKVAYVEAEYILSQFTPIFP